MATTQQALWRRSDPETAREAAVAQHGSGVPAVVLRTFYAHPGLTDDELCAQVPYLYPPTVKSARSRLSKAGELVDSGERRLSDRGRRQIVWRRP